MLTPPQFGAIQTPPISKQAVHEAIHEGRITPRPKGRKINGKTYWQIADNAVMESPRKPGPKAKKKAKNGALGRQKKSLPIAINRLTMAS